MEKGVFASELDRDLAHAMNFVFASVCVPRRPHSPISESTRLIVHSIVCLCPPNFPDGTRPNNKTTAGPSIDNLCIRGIRVCGYFIYWYCCGACYVSEVLGIECVLSRFAVRLGWSLASVSIVPVRLFLFLLLPTVSPPPPPPHLILFVLDHDHGDSSVRPPLSLSRRSLLSVPATHITQGR